MTVPQWKLDQEKISKDVTALAKEFIDKIKDVTELLWPVVSKSYLDVIKPYWAASKHLMDQARKMQRDRAKWEAEQDLKAEMKEPRDTGQDYVHGKSDEAKASGR